MARSSSGPGRRPLKAEITGSTPVRATIFLVINMARFEKHIFICNNKRDASDKRGCCNSKGAEEVLDLFKMRMKQLGLTSKMRVNSSGCLDACSFGPTIVVYPEQVWYGNIKPEDVEEIIQNHIINNQPVERLILKDKKFL